eukprot:TRINITY_DN5303_c0_g1_i4.p1 TRINITY_DN5303_c0_g1~~TRINITY_DN5303_c0_g1_i4.p1  ORF type:complete len:1119 (+),score=138.78 TRINITY_DN5303_c0_g1_i4:4856-8212(+)
MPTAAHVQTAIQWWVTQGVESHRLRLYSQLRKRVARKLRLGQQFIAIELSDERKKKVPLRYQGNLKMLTAEARQARAKLRLDPAIREVISLIWNRMPKTADGSVDFHRYSWMYGKIFAFLFPLGSVADKKKCIKEDWQQDSKDGDELDQNLFTEAMWNFADIWCESLDVADYVWLLEQIREVIFAQMDYIPPPSPPREPSPVVEHNEFGDGLGGFREAAGETFEPGRFLLSVRFNEKGEIVSDVPISVLMAKLPLAARSMSFYKAGRHASAFSLSNPDFSDNLSFGESVLDTLNDSDEETPNDQPTETKDSDRFEPFIVPLEVDVPPTAEETVPSTSNKDSGFSQAEPETLLQTQPELPQEGEPVSTPPTQDEGLPQEELLAEDPPLEAVTEAECDELGEEQVAGATVSSEPEEQSLPLRTAREARTTNRFTQQVLDGLAAGLSPSPRPPAKGRGGTARAAHSRGRGVSQSRNKGHVPARASPVNRRGSASPSELRVSGFQGSSLRSLEMRIQDQRADSRQSPIGDSFDLDSGHPNFGNEDGRTSSFPSDEGERGPGFDENGILAAASGIQDSEESVRAEETPGESETVGDDCLLPGTEFVDDDEGSLREASQTEGSPHASVHDVISPVSKENSVHENQSIATEFPDATEDIGSNQSLENLEKETLAASRVASTNARRVSFYFPENPNTATAKNEPAQDTGKATSAANADANTPPTKEPPHTRRAKGTRLPVPPQRQTTSAPQTANVMQADLQNSNGSPNIRKSQAGPAVHQITPPRSSRSANRNRPTLNSETGSTSPSPGHSPNLGPTPDGQLEEWKTQGLELAPPLTPSPRQAIEEVRRKPVVPLPPPSRESGTKRPAHLHRLVTSREKPASAEQNRNKGTPERHSRPSSHAAEGVAATADWTTLWAADSIGSPSISFIGESVHHNEQQLYRGPINRHCHADTFQYGYPVAVPSLSGSPPSATYVLSPPATGATDDATRVSSGHVLEDELYRRKSAPVQKVSLRGSPPRSRSPVSRETNAAREYSDPELAEMKTRPATTMSARTNAANEAEIEHFPQHERDCMACALRGRLPRVHFPKDSSPPRRQVDMQTVELPPLVLTASAIGLLSPSPRPFSK